MVPTRVTCGRKQVVDIGVPQVSCLGPLLFPTYINDLLKAIKNCIVTSYADGISVYFLNTTLAQLNEAINEDLNSLDIWRKVTNCH